MAERNCTCEGKAEKEKKATGSCYYKMLEMGGEKRLLSLKCKMISRCHKRRCEMKLFNIIIPHLLCYT